MEQRITVRAIGRVQNDVTEMLRPDEIKRLPSRIIIEPALAQGLSGLEIGQEILVLFHFHKSPVDYELLQHPKHDLSRPKRGVFALRSPQRPNRIGATIVEVIQIEGNVLHVRNLDAINDTPVLDIKPM